MPSKKTGKGKDKGSNTRKGQAKNEPAAGGSKKGKKPRKRGKKAGAASTTKPNEYSTDSKKDGDIADQCKSYSGPDPDCQPILGACQRCGNECYSQISGIPRDADWPVDFPLKSTVEYVSATGLQPKTIVSRLKEKLGGKLSHNADSYEKICTDRCSLGIIRKGYKPTWIRRAPTQRVAPSNPSVSLKASQVLDKEVLGLLDKGVIC